MATVDTHMEDGLLDNSTVTSEDPKPDVDLLPLLFCIARQIQGIAFGRPLLLLLDSGSVTSWMNKRAMPKGVHGCMVPKTAGSTLAGTFFK